MNYSRKKHLQIFSIVLILILSAIIYCLIFVRLEKVRQYKELISRFSEQFELDEALVLGIVRVESGFRANIRSTKNACGLMQIKPETFKYVCTLYGASFDLNKIFEPSENIWAGCAYLRYLFGKFSTEVEVLAAYNAGEGNVRRWLNDKALSDNGNTLNVIPFNETKNYINKVLKFKKHYKEINYEGSCSACNANYFIL